VGGARRGDDYLAARRPEGVPFRREGEFVLLDYEDFGVRVDVQARSFAEWRVRDEERHVRADVVLSHCKIQALVTEEGAELLESALASERRDGAGPPAGV
jgi:hypothetical protein